jgi:nucleolin
LTRSKSSSQLSFYQRRWASNDAEEAPISKLQPTPEEEVENVIKTEDAEDVAPVDAAVEAATTTSSSAPPIEDSYASAPAPGAGATQSRSNDGASLFMPPTPSRQEAMSRPKETLYVGNLFFDVTEDDLKREMARFGNVVKCRLLRDARGLSKGFVHSQL